MVIDFISCALRRERPEENLQRTGEQLTPIREDTESKVYASNVREKGLRVVFAGNTTRWHRNGIMKELWGKSTSELMPFEIVSTGISGLSLQRRLG